MTTEHKPHSRREQILRLFEADPRRIADCVVGLEEQHEALLAEWRDYRATTDDIIGAVTRRADGAEEQLEAQGQHLAVVLDEKLVTEVAFSELKEQLETVRESAQEIAARNGDLQEQFEALKARRDALGMAMVRAQDHLRPSHAAYRILSDALNPASSPPANPSYVGPPDYPDSNPASGPKVDAMGEGDWNITPGQQKTLDRAAHNQDKSPD